jgi:hypothetical protein
MFQFTEEERARLIPCLAKSNLVFEVPYLDEQATAQEETLVPWKILDNLITVCLAENNVTIAPPDELHEQEYYNLKWRLCIPGRNSPSGIKTFQEDSVTWYTFNFEHLRKNALPDPLEEGYLVFFVGRLI